MTGSGDGAASVGAGRSVDAGIAKYHVQGEDLKDIQYVQYPILIVAVIPRMSYMGHSINMPPKADNRINYIIHKMISL